MPATKTTNAAARDTTNESPIKSLGMAPGRVAASHFVALSSRVTPVLSEQDIQHLQAHPPASRLQLLQDAIDNFASSGRNVFVHYTEPILQERRTAVLNSGTTKKKYPKTAFHLWLDLPDEEHFFWNEVIARQLQVHLRQKTLSYGECLKYAGKIEDVATCLYFAELAVNRYLGIMEPTPPQPDLAATADPVTYAMAVVIDAVEAGAAGGVLDSFGLPGPPRPETQQAVGTSLPPFEYTRDMMYGFFRCYDLEEIRKADRETQVTLLRQLYERFDDTGKELFYYYMVPRLCKKYVPFRNGIAILIWAHQIWAGLIEREKETWEAANLMVKTQLGNGDVKGLKFLELGSTESEVESLHDMAQTALRLHEKKIKEAREAQGEPARRL